MVPHDLPAAEITLPPGPRDSIALITGNGLRHERLGYLLQRRFPGKLRGWWMHDPPASPPAKPLPKRRRRLGEWLRHLRRVAADALDPNHDATRMTEDRAAIEQQFFAAEVAQLRREAQQTPQRVADVNADAVVSAVQQSDAYTLVVCGGPLLRAPVLSAVRGLAINQHAGWSPELRGAETILMALYHRRLDWVGTTVHVVDAHADAGAILRRTTVPVHPDDQIAHCQLAAVAAGSNLVLDVVAEIIARETLRIYPQLRGGQTLVDWKLRRKWHWVYRDLAGGWLESAIKDQREW